MEYIGRINNDTILINNHHRAIIVFGCGYYGNYLLKYIREQSIEYSMLFFCDNNYEMIGKICCGVKVVSVNEAVKKYSDGIFLVMGKYDKDMIKQLSDMNINSIHLLLNL